MRRWQWSDLGRALPPRPQIDHNPGGRAPSRDPLRGWTLAAAVGTIVALALPAHLDWLVRSVAAWDAAVLILLGPLWRIILRSNPEQTRQRAAAEDPGRVALLLIAVVASAIGLAASIASLRRPPLSVSATRADLIVTLGVVAVTGAWALLHTAFALHYAHLCYR